MLLQRDGRKADPAHPGRLTPGTSSRYQPKEAARWHAGLDLRAPRRPAQSGRDAGAEPGRSQASPTSGGLDCTASTRSRGLGAFNLVKGSDEQCRCKATCRLEAFSRRHPQLGPVEIGGWDKMNYWRNPPPALREREAARFPKWMTKIALSLPRLELLRTEVRALGGDTWRIWLPLSLASGCRGQDEAVAPQRKTVRGVIFWKRPALEGNSRSRWSAKNLASKGLSSRATRRRRRSTPSCRTAS